ncbi:hypothetical protein LJC46_01310 [Desulfovibrio sp. OttesenSCG-928-G15]|nr:hypothetical protein [Desulfovibrio sp. OttesenSCG-928-G15]
MMKTTRTLVLLAAVAVCALGLCACAAKDNASDDAPRVQVKGQYDISVGTTKS